MRFTLVFAIAFSMLVSAATQAQRPSKQYGIEDFINTESVAGASISPDGSKVLITSDRTGILNAYALPVSGREAVPLTTSSTESIVARSYFPADERFIYEADQGGNELTHVYVRGLDGTAKDLTPGDKLKASFAGWADDLKSFFVVTNERDPRYFDFYEITLDGYKRMLLYENKDGRDVQAISPDRRFLALGKENTRKDSDVFLLDRQTGETKELLNPAGDVLCVAQTFADHGKSIYYLTNKDHEFMYLVKRDLATGAEETLLKKDWDVMYGRLSRSGRYLMVAVNMDARTELHVMDLTTGNPVALPKLDGLKIINIYPSWDEKSIAFYVEGGKTPGDLYFWTLGSTEKPVQLTHRLNPALNSDDLVEPEVVRYASYDGVKVPGILYRPLNATPAHKVPALVYVHGGPGGETRADWNALIQFLVNHGYAVFGINNRGSSGSGKTFYAMDDQKHGESDLDDCVASKKMLIDTGWIDPDHIGIIGGSYGGYMVCAALAFRPGEFNVGVDLFGVTNWVRTLKSIPPWWEAGRKSLYLEMGDPATQEDYLTKISPLFHAKNIKDPLIVLQGKNDPRVLQVESDEMVAGVRANDVPVDYVIFPDEGHGFRKKANQITGYDAVMKFLNAHMPAK